MTSTGRRVPTRGGPLVMLVILLGGWGAGRAIWWEHPFSPDAPVLGLSPAGLRRVAAPGTALPERLPGSPAWQGVTGGGHSRLGRVPAAVRPRRPDPLHRAVPLAGPVPAAAPSGDPAPAIAAAPAAGRMAEPARAAAPFLPAPPPPVGTRPPGRWSLDGWAFWRQGSDDAPISQGRVPIYGASQAGAVLQYRLAPSSRRDPRLYARAYRALVTGGESEVALGASLRPLGGVPVRLMGEVRYTDAAVFDRLRPAALAVTEIAPLRLPYGAEFEAYAQAGWVGGPGATGFADGQASITRALPAVARATGERLRLSLGGAVWGGAQEDAQRLDVGPTLRLDTRIGTVPARLSIDWRQRVAGEASPGSGVAATLAAGF